jgi:histidyl-tRNA synthetase
VKNPLRLLDCKQPACQAAADAAPKSSEHLCHECDDHFRSVQGYLQRLGVPFNINHRLVRGLDYYTRTVFEIQPPDEGSQSAVGGGGRYDNLIEELGGSPAPAIGFGTGIERIILNLKKQGVHVPDSPGANIVIAYLGDEAKLEAVKLTSFLRRNGIPAIMAMGDRSLKAQLRQANNLDMEYTVIIGDEELKNRTVTLRNMKTSEQQSVAVEKLIDIFE